jgi:hypothetical protein
MAKVLQLARGLALPIDAVTQTFGFLGKRGGGKTYAAGKLTELMLDANAQVVVLDPVGNWFGLRIAANGRGKGFDLPVFGGRNGDIPLEPKSGRLVAQYVVDHRISLVLDVSGFRKRQQKEFVTDFAEELFELKKTSPSALHLVMEECQRFMPQKVWKGSERMLGALEDIIKLGRNYGIGASLISQRPQAVNKDCLNQTECLVVLQTTGSQERKAIKNWIVEKDIDVAAALDELPSLPVGTAYVWSPQWLGILKRVKINRKRTFDASATPKVGEKRKPPKPLTKADLKRLQSDMESMVKKAEENDPRALKAQVIKLQAQLAQRKTEVVEKVIEHSIIRPSDLGALEGVVHDVGEACRALRETADRLEGAVRPILAAAKAAPKQPPARRRSQRAPAVASPQPRDNGAAAAPRRTSNGLARGARHMLAALGTRHPDPLTRRQLATLAQLKPTGGSFRTYLSALRTQGLIEGRDTLQLTQAGLAYVGTTEQPQTTEELVALWCSKLSGSAKGMLRVLVDAYPRGFNREDLADAVQMEVGGGSFRTYLSALRTNGLIDTENGEIRASPSLFLN